MFNIKIKHKILILFLVISLLPLVLVNYLLISTTQNRLKQAAYASQEAAAIQASNRVDSFIGAKVNNMIFQSQTTAMRKFQTSDAELNLATTIKQDLDLVRIALVDKNGDERAVADQNGVIKKFNNVSKEDSFKSATFLAGKEYIGPVRYDTNKEPHVVVAVPLIRFNEQQDLSKLSTAEFGKYRSPDDITGVLIADFRLTDLWETVLATKIGQDGYAYVIDDKGNLIAHPNLDFLRNHQSLTNVHQVSEFLQNAGNHKHESISETGENVLSRYQLIDRTNWAVIVEEPISSVFSNVNSLYRQAAVSFIAVTVVVVILSLFFRRQLLSPIRDLVDGAHRIGAGDLGYKLPISSKDELGNLAESFNKMGQSLSQMVGSLKQRNITLISEQNKLNNIIESVSDGIIAINRSGQIVFVNVPAAKLVGRLPAVLVGKPVDQIFRWTRNSQKAKLSFNEPGIFLYDGLQLVEEEHTSYVDLVVAVLTSNVADVAAIITVRDLTQSRELEVMKQDFVAIAAHELRTPLTFMRGYLELIKNEHSRNLPPVGLERLQKAMMGVDQLGNLINNLLNVSKVERGTMQVSISKLDLTELTQNIVEQHKIIAKLRQQKVTFINEEPSEHLFVPADASAISEVLTNLLGNAIKYAPENGDIKVIMSRHGDFVRIEVKDNGAGIPEAAQEHLFQKFYRVEHSLNTGNRGTGLGLFISKAIIELQGGKIGVQSSPGRGATFFFTLPIYQASKHDKLVIKGNPIGGVHGWIAKNSTD